MTSRRAMTLIELLVVAMIITVISAISVVSVTGLVRRARIAATRGTIRAMEVAADRYEIEFGQYPMSSTGQDFGVGASPVPVAPGNGNGYFLLSVLHTMSGDASTPLHSAFPGPLLDVETTQIGGPADLNASWGLLTSISDVAIPAGIIGASWQQMLDAWGNPFRYVRSGPGALDSTDYVTYGGTEYPPTHPNFFTVVYYNYDRFQIISLGPDETTIDNTAEFGLDTDDITNFGGGM